MKKIFYLAISIALVVMTSGCSGYKPIFNSENLQFKIANHTIVGNQDLGNRIYAKLHNLSKSDKGNQNKKEVSITIETTKNKIANIKNSAGKIIEYKISLVSKIKINDFSSMNVILDNSFTNSITYKVQDQYSDTVNLENQTIENLINKTYQDLIIKFSENIN